MKRLLLAALTILIAVSCSKDDPEINGKVLIRIKNASGFDFKDIQVRASGGDNVYGNLDAHKTSAYKAFESAYRYSYIELKINDGTFILQPIDYVGETPLDPGKYTYELNADAADSQFGSLSLKCEED